MADSTDGPGVHVPPPFFYVAAIGGGVARVVAAWLFVALFLVLLLWSFAWFARQKTTVIPDKPATALVLDGPFRLTRNPLYVAMALLTIGAGLWLNTWWVLILLAPALLAVDRLVIAREEAYLRRRFGAEYEAYTVRVRRWL